MQLDDFDYRLPEELIAQAPAAERAASRLLHLDGASGTLVDRRFADLPALIGPEDVMVFNDTRVIHARIAARKATGGRVEIMVERVLEGGEVIAQVGANHPTRQGAMLLLPGGARAEVLGRERGFFRLRLEGCGDVHAYLQMHGSVPLPLYIRRPATPADEGRYQTIYAREPGAVAAPTAGLHFDEATMTAIRARGAAVAWITLHVGAGTFQPVRQQDLSRHEMHAERYRVPQETVEAVARARSRGGRVLAVGTTTLRALESAAEPDGSLRAEAGETRLFIVPGYRFRVVERLLTNFHLPRSTLLMLVSAFGGMERIRAAYRHAIDAGYRFYSYGDAMLIERAPEAGTHAV